AAGITTFSVLNWMEKWRTSLVDQGHRPSTELVDVLVAAQPLPVGTLLQREHLRWQGWPKDGLTSGFMQNGETDPKTLRGTVVRYPVPEGAPLSRNSLIEPGERGFLAAVLPA